MFFKKRFGVVLFAVVLSFFANLLFVDVSNGYGAAFIKKTCHGGGDCYCYGVYAEVYACDGTTIVATYGSPVTAKLNYGSGYTYKTCEEAFAVYCSQSWCNLASGMCPSCEAALAALFSCNILYPGGLGITDLRTADQKASGTCDPPDVGGTTGDKGNPPSCNKNSVDMGSSANLKSGNLYHSQDAGILTLSYNSIDISSGALGKKWTHNYDSNLLISGSNIRLKTDDGNLIFFKQTGGVYYPEARSGDTSRITYANNIYTRTTKDGTMYKYTSAGLLTSITDKNGNTTALTYNGADLASITDQNGRITTITTTAGKITGITDALGRTHTLGYDATTGMLSSITDPSTEGNTWYFTYDPSGRMLTKKDPKNNTITYTYKPDGKLLSSTDPQGKVRTMDYTTTNASTFTEKDGGLWQYTYDPTFAVKTSKTDPLGNTTYYTYDAQRNLTRTTYPDGSHTDYTYDTAGNMLTVTDALSKTTTYTYNSLNLVATVTDPRGNTTLYGYDAKGNLTSVTDAASATTQYQYDTRGNIIAIINPLGKITTMTYDQYNNLISVTDPKSGTVTMTYDALGNMLSQTDALNKTTYFQYNSLNQMIQVTDPLGNVTIFTYDYKGNRLSATDANSNTTWYVYDYKSQLTKITDALTNVTEMAYGGAGCSSCSGVDKLTALTDAKNQTTAYEYDLAGRLIKETDPLGKITTYTYDTKGNMITRTSPDNKTITYSYNLAGKLIQKTYSDGTFAVFEYDNAGNMTYAGNQNIAYNMTYDADNRNAQITDSSARRIQYQYDAAGNRTALITPDGRTIIYTYDNNNLLNQITTNLGAFTFGYDADNRRITRALPNGTTAAYSYDAGSRLLGIATTKGAATIDSVAYTHDNVGNRLTKSQPAVSNAYNYDEIYRLKQATPTGGTQPPEAYTYDEVGNRLTKVPDTSPNANETVVYGYDDENRLTSVLITANNKTKQLSFAYDPFGRRISKTLTKDEIGTDCQSPNVCPRTTNYVYDGQSIILEYQNGNITAKYIHGPNIDEPLAMEKNAQVYYYHADGLGSITSLSDPSGSIVQTYSYDSFGNMTATGTITQPYTFTAREYDSETGMYFYRARYYDSKVGRFVTKDPIGFGGGINQYAYVGNNPVNKIDPLGLEVDDPIYTTPYSPENWFPKKPGKCIYCDLNALNDCLMKVVTTPGKDTPCAKCTVSKGKDRTSCAACIVTTYIGIGECYYRHCKIEDCCENK